MLTGSSIHYSANEYQKGMIGLLHIVDDMSSLKYMTRVQSVKIVYNDSDAAYSEGGQAGAHTKVYPIGKDSVRTPSDFQKKLYSLISVL